MDGQRFDEVARLIGTGASRRRVLKGLATGLLGLGGAAAIRRGAGAQQGECVLTGNPCVSEDSECCGGGEGIVCAGVPRSCQQIASCVGGTGPCNPGKGLNCCDNLVCDVTDNGNGTCVPAPPACADLGGECATTDDCCEGLTCDNGACTAAAECADLGGGCEVNENCCEGLVCGENHTCIAAAECAAEGEGCEADEQCCDGICCAGVCRNIACCIDDADPNARCPKGTTCFEGVCDPVCQADTDCAGDACCCPDGSCSGDCCKATGDETGGEDTGTPTTLPATGVGHESGSSSLLGAGILAAGAAFVAGKKLRKREDA